ncbi:MAG: hypothetical protein WC626_09660 [Methanoregula sp.]
MPEEEVPRWSPPRDAPYRGHGQGVLGLAYEWDMAVLSDPATIALSRSGPMALTRLWQYFP